MKFPLKKLSLGLSVLLVSSLSNVSAAPITITNPGFEATSVSANPNAKVASGFDSTPDIAGWINTTGTFGDSGVENNAANSNTGSQYAFLRGDNGGAYQITNYQLKLGDQLSLTFFTKNVFSGGNSSVSLLSAATQSDSFSLATTLVNRTDALTQTVNGGPYQTFTLAYTAGAADVGRFVGLSFDNTGNGGGYTFYDDFSLAVTSVPEPSTVVSLVGGAALLIGMRRKRSPKV